MATYKSLGYEYEFVYKVPSKYFCQQCKHVARNPSITSCCGECLCKACTNSMGESNKSCLFCKKKDFEIEENLNYKDKIEALTVYCSLKDKGCKWTGQLQYLNTHLSNDCVVDRMKCDQCQENVQRSKLDTHLTQECPEREYMCKYCNYKATYKMVTELHFKICTYYILNCPNRCGATFERGELEDHMKMCAQERIQCEFNYAGCQAEFQRDQEKEHMEQNTQLHLALVAATLRKQQQRLLELTCRENEGSFSEQEGVGDDRGLGGWPQVLEVNLQHRYEEFENRINERAEQVEQLLQDREQRIREVQEGGRRDGLPDVHRPWTCSMMIAILAAGLLAVMLGLHIHSQPFYDPDQSPIEDSQPSPRGNTPDSSHPELLEELQRQIRELQNSIHNLQQPEQPAPTVDEVSYNKRFTKLEEEIQKVRQLLEDSLRELTLKVTSQYTETQQDYKLAIGNLEVKIQEVDKKLSDMDLRLQSQDQARDKKIEELVVRVNGMGDMRVTVVGLEQQMSELSAKLIALEQGLSELKRQFDDLPSHPPHHHPPRHHHPPHPPHPHHHHRHF